jgi:hypothetical protein
VTVVASDPIRRRLPWPRIRRGYPGHVVHTAVEVASTPDLVLVMPAGQVALQRTIRRIRSVTSALKISSRIVTNLASRRSSPDSRRVNGVTMQPMANCSG